MSAVSVTSLTRLHRARASPRGDRSRPSTGLRARHASDAGLRPLPSRPVAVAATAVVHLANNLFKLVLVGWKAGWTVVVRFALPAAAAMSTRPTATTAAMPATSARHRTAAKVDIGTLRRQHGQDVLVGPHPASGTLHCRLVVPDRATGAVSIPRRGRVRRPASRPTHEPSLTAIDGNEESNFSSDVTSETPSSSASTTNSQS